MTARKTDIELRHHLSPIELAHDLETLNERRLRQVELSAAQSTRDAYAFDMGQFEAWCQARGAKHLPCKPDMLGLYLADLERRGRRPNTIGRKLAAVVRYHKANGYRSPRTATISEQMRGIRRGEDAMDSAPSTHQHLVVRDKAVLLIGWACAMRRSEIAALQIGDVEDTREGWQVWIRRSKTDKTSQGIALALAPAERNRTLCPIDALEQWLVVRQGDANEQPPGALFWKSKEQRSHRAVAPQLEHGQAMPWYQVNRMIRRWCSAAELGSGHSYSPHSLRSGFITEAINMGRPIANTMERSRHVSMDVFFKYVRIAMTFENNVQKGLL